MARYVLKDIQTPPVGRATYAVVLVFSDGNTEHRIRLKDDFEHADALVTNGILRRVCADLVWDQVPIDVQNVRIITAVSSILKTQGRKVSA